MADINYIFRVYYLNSTNYHDYTNAEIGINPTISKSMCSGGFSVGNTATASLAITIPNFPSWDKGCKAELLANGTKVMGDWFVSEIEGAEYHRNKLTCYDLMSKADDNITDFGTTETTIDGATLMSLIAEKIGAEVTPDFGTLDIAVSDIQSSTMREMLSIIGNFGGCNFAMRGNTLTAIPIDFSGNEIAPVVRTNMSDIISAPFTNIIMSNGKENFTSGGGDINHTLKISSKYATQAQADIVMDDIKDHNYSSFKCEKCLLSSIADIGDTFVPFSGSADTSYKIMQLQLYFSKAGIYASLGADTQKKTLDDEKPSTGGGDLPEQITNFIAGTSGQTAGTIDLTWTNPTSNFDGVVIKRKKGAPMASIYEGEIVYASNGKEHIDTIPLPYYDYYYRAVTWLGDFWNGKLNQIKVTAIQCGKYLYNAGDKCVALTGGWSGGDSVTATNLYHSTSMLKFNTDHALIDTFDTSTISYRLYGMRTTTKINFEGFTKVCAEVEVTDIIDFDITNGYGDNTVNTQGTPYYSYADTVYETNPAVTATDYPYIVISYRGTSNSYSYTVDFCKNKPALIYNSVGQMSLLLYGDRATVEYWIAKDGTISKGNVYRNTSTTRTLALIHAQGVPDTVTWGDYMGGGYTDGRQCAYYMSVNPDVVPDGRVFVGTLKDNNYMYTNCVSFEKGIKTGEYVIKADINDIDNSTNPPTRTGYVCVGGFESNVKVKAVWLEP